MTAAATRLSSAVVICLALARGASASADVEIRGRVLDPSGAVLPGVTVTLTPAQTSALPVDVTTDASGSYVVRVPAGEYRLTARLEGFKTVERTGLVVREAPLVVDITMPIETVREEENVHAQPATMIDDPTPNGPIVLERHVIDNAMLPNSQFDDVLTLMPNVVRGPDGLISVAGARASQTALVVNRVSHSDPISGQPLVMLPIEAVDSASVYSGGYAADLGPATGGVTSVVTRAGDDTFRMTANSFFPRLLLENGGVHGVEYWEPNVGASGPIVKGRAFFEQAVSARYDRNRVETVSGEQISQYNALMSWSQLNLKASPSQQVVATLSFDPQRTDQAGMTAFTTASTAPVLEQGGWSAAIADEISLGPRKTEGLELRASVLNTSTIVTPPGAVPYAIGHTATAGSYFDQQNLQGRRIGAGATYFAPIGLSHQLTIGASVDRASLAGSDASAPVGLLRSDGSVARLITFGAGSPVSAATYETATFVQDSWKAASWATVDLGLRYDRVSAAAHGTLSPRAGATVQVWSASVTGSVGLFADAIPLRALAFPSFAGRTVLSSGGSGLSSTAIQYTNQIPAPLDPPRATRWDVEVSRRFADRWLTRVKYQERYGRDELVIDPRQTSPNTGTLVLDSTGTSTARSLEATVGFRPPGSGRELYVSYVRSRTSGDLNSFDALEGPFQEPFVQPNAIGPLPADVPNRLLTWGVFQLPGRFTISPFVEIRDGFAYSAIDDTWAYVGPRQSYRLPWYGALDFYVNKIVGLPYHLPDARIGLKIYNLVSTNAGRDVQRDISRPDFGALYNPTPRDFTFVFELLLGR